MTMSGAYPPPPQHVRPAPANGVGIAALVCGLCALATCWIPIVGVIAWPLGIVGVILGAVGWARARRGSADNLGVAVAGTVTSAVALVVCVLWLAVFGAAAVAAPNTPTRTAQAAPSPAQVQPVAPPAKTGPATTVSDGVYQVGPDLVAGRYKTQGPDASDTIPNCYWARTRDDSGSFQAIIANGNVSGPGSVTVKPGEFVTFNGGCTWTKQ